MARRFLSATGLVTPSHIVVCSRCKSAKEYTVGSVFKREGIARFYSVVRFDIQQPIGFVTVRGEPGLLRLCIWIRGRSFVVMFFFGMILIDGILPLRTF